MGIIENAALTVPTLTSIVALPMVQWVPAIAGSVCVAIVVLPFWLE